MIVLLVAGIACLALCAFQLTRPRRDAERDRRAALRAFVPPLAPAPAPHPQSGGRCCSVGSRRCSSAFT